jgi:hypothetical protein
MALLLDTVASAVSGFTGWNRKQNVKRSPALKVQAIAGSGARVDKFKKTDVM